MHLGCNSTEQHEHCILDWKGDCRRVVAPVEEAGEEQLGTDLVGDLVVLVLQ